MKNVLILLSTYNGEKFLPQLLDSLNKQKLTNINLELMIRDDGSIDQTINIIKQFDTFKTTIISGENIGAAKSFFYLVKHCPVTYDYYMFCDQDDYWLEDKIQCAVDSLKEFDKNNVPSLYYGSVKIVNEELMGQKIFFNPIENSRSVPISLLLGSLIPGCTMCCNKNLLICLKRHIPNCKCLHDSWTHLICLLNKGIIICDEVPHILYRQHDSNVVGMKKLTLVQKIRRLLKNKKLYSKCYKEIYHFKLYNKAYEEILFRFAYYDKNISQKTSLLKEVKRQLSKKRRIKLYLKILFNRF